MKASLVLGCLLRAGVACAEVKLPALFSDHMVVQAGAAVPVWGWAEPGEEVTVALAGQSRKATTSAEGKWLVRLGNLEAQTHPHEMTVTGRNQLTIGDVLVILRALHSLPIAEKLETQTP